MIATVVTCEVVIDYKRFSSLNKLLRVLAYVLRFINNIKNKKEDRKIGTMTVLEINRAKLVIVKLVQDEAFQEDIKALRNGKVQRSSKLTSLHPFLDSKGVLRIGGRLKHALLPEEIKHPILLPAMHYFTTLLIVHHHERLLHAGAQTTLNSIREEFWPIFAKSRVKKVLR